MDTDGLDFTPVIMAGGGHREMWPLSRVNAPIQFLRDASGTSPFLAWLAFFADIAEAGRPTVVVTVSAVENARRQIAESGAGARLVVLPSERGIRPASCIAALLQEDERRLVFADAPTPPTRREAFENVLDSLASGHAAGGGTVLSALPVTAGADIRRGERCDKGGLIRPGASSPEPRQGGYRLGPLWTATPREIVAGIEATDANMVRVCRVLAREAERVGEEVWIDGSRWSHLDAHRRRLAVLASLANAKLRPVALHADDEGRPVVRANVTEGDVVTIASRNCDVRSRDHLTVLVGCENLRVMATGDATLVAAPGQEEAIEQLVDEMWLAERPEAFAHRRERHGWGHERELFRSHDYGVRMLEVEPGHAAEEHGAQGCEVWTLARGRAVLGIDGRETPMRTGTSRAVAPGATVRLRNCSDERLVAIIVATTDRPHVDAPPLQGEPHQAPRRETDQQREAEPLVERLQPGAEEAPADQHAGGREDGKDGAAPQRRGVDHAVDELEGEADG